VAEGEDFRLGHSGVVEHTEPDVDDEIWSG